MSVDEMMEAAVARALARADEVDFDEVCGEERDPPINCDSITCVAAWDEDHNAERSRRYYQSRARVVIAEMRTKGWLAAGAPPHGLDSTWADVLAFHVTFSHPHRDRPGLQPADRVMARADWIAEEVGELREAASIVDQADAYLDILYFAIGGLVEMGVRPGPLWDIIHGANMAKVQPDGSVARRADGKILKPEGWRPPLPLQVAEIERQIGRDHDDGGAPASC